MTRTEPKRAVGEASGDRESHRLSLAVEARRRLKQLVRESRYSVDERQVAKAILTRARRLTADRTEVEKHPAWTERQMEQLYAHADGATGAAPARSGAPRDRSAREPKASNHAQP